MSGRKSRDKKRANAHYLYAHQICPNCGRRGAHFAPPSLGEPGFFVCQAPPPKPAAPLVDHPGAPPWERRDA